MKEKVYSCPACGSDRITCFATYDYVVGRNVKTGKIIYRDKNPETGTVTLYSYRCRKCGLDYMEKVGEKWDYQKIRND